MYDLSFKGDTIVGHLISFTTTAPATSGFLWDFGDGTSATTRTPDHTYSVSGRYSVSLTVDKDNSHKIAKSIMIGNNCSFDYSGNPIVGEAVSFHFLYPPPAGSNYFWDFGDGTTSTDSFPTHVYTGDRIYAIQVSVNVINVVNKQIRIYKDPVYTHQMGGNRLWHRKETATSFSIVDDPLGDASFTLDIINAVTVSFLQKKYIYCPDSSTVGMLFFTPISNYNPDLLDYNDYSGFNGSLWYAKLLYDYAKDSMTYIYHYETYPNVTSGHPPPTVYNGVWHTP